MNFGRFNRWCKEKGITGEAKAGIRKLLLEREKQRTSANVASDIVKRVEEECEIQS